MAISVDSTYLLNYPVDSVNSAEDKLTSTIQNASEDTETLEACKQFEAYMIEQMYKGMEEATKVLTEDEEDSEGSEYLDMFSDTYLQDLTSKMMSSGQGLGIAEKLYESIQKNAGQTVTTES